MKFKLFLFSLLMMSVFISNSYSQQNSNGWYWLNGKPSGNTLNWVKVVDAANIYAVGERGTFMKSVDGGDTWAVNTQVGELDTDQWGCLSHLNLYTGWFMDANTGISLISDVVFIIRKYPFSLTSWERAFSDDITNPSSKTLPSYFSWSFTTTPMILELFLASRMPAIFEMYPEFSSSCWTLFTVSSEIFSVLP